MVRERSARPAQLETRPRHPERPGPARGDLAPGKDLQTEALAFRARGRDAAHRVVISQRDPIETGFGRVAHDLRRLEGAVGYIGMGVQVVSRQTRSRR